MALTKISTGGVKDDAVSQAIIADETIDEARLQISNAGSDGQFLSKESGNTGGLTWATVDTSIADDAVTQAKIADEAVDEARLQISNAGSNGQFLSKESGNTGGLTWATPSSGAWTKLTSGTFSSSDGTEKTITTSHLTSTHKLYKLSMHFVMTADNFETGLQVQIGGAWQESGYTYEMHGQKEGSHDDSSRGGKTRIHFGDDNWYSQMYTVEIFFSDIDTATRTLFNISGSQNNATGSYSNKSVYQTFGSIDDASAITGLRVKATKQVSGSGTFDYGWFVLEGCAI